MSKFLMFLSIFSATTIFQSQKAFAEEKVLNLAIWSNYLPKEIEDKFTQETGIKIKMSYYNANEELLAKIQAGATGFDLAVPSDYMVDIMIKENLLSPIDKSKLVGYSNLNPLYLNQSFDKENKYSVPYSWSTAGIAVNRDLYKGKIDSWKDLWENPALKGKIAMLDDVRETTGAALKFLGYSINTQNASELNKAKELLINIKKNVKEYNSNSVDLLLKKEVVAAHSYSTDALQAQMKYKGKIEYIIPKEGGTRAIDNMVIPKGAKNTDAAYKLINFMLKPEINKIFVTVIRGGPVLKETEKLLAKDITQNKSLFPSTQVMSRLEAIHDVGENTKLYDDLWTEVKTK